MILVDFDFAAFFWVQHWNRKGIFRHAERLARTGASLGRDSSFTVVIARVERAGAGREWRGLSNGSKKRGEEECWRYIRCSATLEKSPRSRTQRMRSRHSALTTPMAIF